MYFVIFLSLALHYVPNKTPGEKKVLLKFGTLTVGIDKAPLCCRKADSLKGIYLQREWSSAKGWLDCPLKNIHNIYCMSKTLCLCFVCSFCFVFRTNGLSKLFCIACGSLTAQHRCSAPLPTLQ